MSEYLHHHQTQTGEGLDEYLKVLRVDHLCIELGFVPRSDHFHKEQKRAHDYSKTTGVESIAER